MRLEGWEARLGQVVENARSEPYKLGEHDCFRVACWTVQALTGLDRWPEFAGQYSTVREAMGLIAKYGSNFEDAFDWFFGSKRVSPKLARRGDIVCIQTSDGQKHLGVCLGAQTALLSPHGLIFSSTLHKQVLCAWMVG